MVDQHGRGHPVQVFEPFAGVRHPVPAPGVAGGVRFRREQVLVGADDVAFLGQCQPLGLGGGSLGQERVVIEQEHRHDGGRPALLVPHRERVLGGQHAHLVAHVDQIVVAGPPEDLHRVLVGGPQLVVARHPDDLGEPFPQQIQRPANLIGTFADIAGDDQPVVRARRVQRFGDRLVAGVTGVQVADRPQHRSSLFS